MHYLYCDFISIFLALQTMKTQTQCVVLIHYLINFYSCKQNKQLLVNTINTSDIYKCNKYKSKPIEYIRF